MDTSISIAVTKKNVLNFSIDYKLGKIFTYQSTGHIHSIAAADVAALILHTQKIFSVSYTHLTLPTTPYV